MCIRDRPGLIGERLGLEHVHFLPAVKALHERFVPDGGEFGIALLSRWPALEVRELMYQPYWFCWRRTQRNAYGIRVRPDEWETDVWIVTTHLGLDCGCEQYRQAVELRGFVQELQTLDPGAAVLVCGDLARTRARVVVQWLP
eukprot:TRINITY_DN20654_c0_g1_i3.p1 TRINITY_DN20654_c0_g1~~TRINITY_DN20654_c0_g1_i3.p1  ORF type:complete len:143 (+),score=24.29 TRINITY_DN20654_c0_g1_i3:108-536(+)